MGIIVWDVIGVVLGFFFLGNVLGVVPWNVLGLFLGAVQLYGAQGWVGLTFRPPAGNYEEPFNSPAPDMMRERCII